MFIERKVKTKRERDEKRYIKEGRKRIEEREIERGWKKKKRDRKIEKRRENGL